MFLRFQFQVDEHEIVHERDEKYKITKKRRAKVTLLFSLVEGCDGAVKSSHCPG
jgi:hypothetical protein